MGQQEPGIDRKIDYDVACSNGVFTENYEIELPAAMNVLTVPTALELRSSVQTYRAEYALRDNTLVARRVFADTTSTSLCSPEVDAEYSKLGGPIKHNIQERVLYTHH